MGVRFWNSGQGEREALAHGPSKSVLEGFWEGSPQAENKKKRNPNGNWSHWGFFTGFQTGGERHCHHSHSSVPVEGQTKTIRQ